MVLALACGLLAWAMFTGKSALAPIGVALSVWLVAGAAGRSLVAHGAGRTSATAWAV
jgi:cytochrome c-type biogenesis protein CcmF